MPQEEIKVEINRAFNNFKSLVYSEEEIVGISEYLIDVNFAATNGMSGGSILCNTEFIGVYVGDPPLSGQYQLL